MKRVVKYGISAMLMWVILAVPAFAAEMINAAPSNNPIENSGTIIENIPVYKINGENYFKLRDIGYLMDFGVVWNGSAKCVEIQSNAPSDGLQVSSGKATINKTATRSSQPIYINGILNTDMTAYLIDGNNYFRLRELAKKVDFGCLYDNATGTVLVNKTCHYDENKFGSVKDKYKITVSQKKLTYIPNTLSNDSSIPSISKPNTPAKNQNPPSEEDTGYSEPDVKDPPKSLKILSKDYQFLSFLLHSWERFNACYSPFRVNNEF